MATVLHRDLDTVKDVKQFCRELCDKPHKINVHGLGIYVDLKTKEISIPAGIVNDWTKQQVLKGALIHELGHLNFTPAKGYFRTAALSPTYQRLVNLFEDIRQESKTEAREPSVRRYFQSLYDWAVESDPSINDLNSWNLCRKIYCHARGYTSIEFESSEWQNYLEENREFIVTPRTWEEVKLIAKKLYEKLFKNEGGLGVPPQPGISHREREQNERVSELEKAEAALGEKKDQLAAKKEAVQNQIDRIKELNKQIEKTRKELRDESIEPLDHAELEEQLEDLKKEVQECRSSSDYSDYRALKDKVKECSKSCEQEKKKLVASTGKHHEEHLYDFEKLNDYLGDSIILVVEEGMAPEADSLEASDILQEIIPVLKELADDRKHGKHIPLTTKFDKLEVVKTSRNVFQGDSEVAKDCFHLESKIQRFFKVKSQKVDLRGLKYGKLDRRRLHKTRTIFKQTEERTKINTAIQIVLDHSGSMGNIQHNVARVAHTIHAGLQRNNIPHEIVSYTAHPSVRMMESKIRGVGDSRFRRQSYHLMHRVYKEFGSAACDLSEYLNRGEQNVDNESIRFLSKRLLVRPEKRKVMFIFTDGVPYCPGCDTIEMLADLRRYVKKLMAQGVEVITFDLSENENCYKYLKAVYPNVIHVNIDNLVDDLLAGFQKHLFQNQVV